jgi:hypothetical protein
MRKLIIGAVAAAALLCAPVAAGAATAGPLGSTPVDSPWTPVPDSQALPGENPLPAGIVCTFAVQAAVVTNNEFQNVTQLPDGGTVTKIRGNLVLSFENLSTGKTIEKNVSGPTTTTASADQSNVTFQGEGLNWFAIGPHGQANTGEPGLVFTNGRLTVTIANGTVQTFSLHGTQENGCTLLS